MVLILSQDDVKSVLTMKDCVQAVEDGFRQFSIGKVVMPQRPTIRIPEYKALINVMPAYVGGIEVVGVKLVAGYADNPALHNLPTVQGLIVLSDARDGRVLAVMDGTYITAMRTGATSAVATKYLAKEGASSVAIIGAGVQARKQLMGVCAVRNISAARVYDVQAEAMTKFASEMSESLGLVVKPVGTVKEAVDGVQIICTASTSKTPVLEANMIEPGVHINGIGSHSPDARELDSALVAKSKLVVDTREAALKEAGDIIIPLSEGLISESHIYAELGEIVTGKKKGRTSLSEITLFKSQGLAIEDVSTAFLVFNQAEGRGVGKEVEI